MIDSKSLINVTRPVVAGYYGPNHTFRYKAVHILRKRKFLQYISAMKSPFLPLNMISIVYLERIRVNPVPIFFSRKTGAHDMAVLVHA